MKNFEKLLNLDSDDGEAAQMINRWKVRRGIPLNFWSMLAEIAKAAQLLHDLEGLYVRREQSSGGWELCPVIESIPIELKKRALVEGTVLWENGELVEQLSVKRPYPYPAHPFLSARRIYGITPEERDERAARRQQLQTFPLDGSPLWGAVRWSVLLGHACSSAVLQLPDPTVQEVQEAQEEAFDRGVFFYGDDDMGIFQWALDYDGALVHETCTGRTHVRVTEDSMEVELRAYRDTWWGATKDVAARLVWDRGERVVLLVVDRDAYLRRRVFDNGTRLGSLADLFEATGDALLRLAGVESIQELEARALAEAQVDRWENIAEAHGY